MHYRVMRTVLDSASFGFANQGDLVEVYDKERAVKMVNDGILEEVDMKKAQYFTKVETVAEKAVEVPVNPEAPDEVKEAEKKPGRPKKED